MAKRRKKVWALQEESSIAMPEEVAQSQYISLDCAMMRYKLTKPERARALKDEEAVKLFLSKRLSGIQTEDEIFKILDQF